MKKTFIILFYFIFSNFINGQNLNIKFVEQITKVSFLDIDNVMINGYGFIKVSDEDNGNKKKYAKIPDDSDDNAIFITLFKPKNEPINTLSIFLAKNYNIQKIKRDLMENEFLYLGENKNGFWQYQKEKIVCLISKEPSNIGANQILILYKK